jgi:hypothetical protein
MAVSVGVIQLEVAVGQSPASKYVRTKAEHIVSIRHQAEKSLNVCCSVSQSVN